MLAKDYAKYVDCFHVRIVCLARCHVRIVCLANPPSGVTRALISGGGGGGGVYIHTFVFCRLISFEMNLKLKNN